MSGTLPPNTGNPQVPLGTLNRLRASLAYTSFPELNVTSSFLTREGLSIGFEGDSGEYLEVLTGGVTSPSPYQFVTVTINLVRSMGLVAAYKSQIESTVNVGDVLVKTDAQALPNFPLVNCMIMRPGEIAMAGRDANWRIMLRGTYYINNNLWNVT